MLLTVKDLVKFFQEKAPGHLAEGWDNVGLHAGCEDWKVQNILLTLDIDESTIEEAIQKNCQFIVAHHPIIFKPIPNITSRDKTGRILLKAIENKIALLCLHTNLDIVENGVNDALAETLNLNDIQILKETGSEKCFKVAVYVPNENVDSVLTAMAENGAGCIGNYDNCSFQTQGNGTFRGLENSNPAIGIPGKLERVEETKIEMIVPSGKLHHVLNAMKTAHPYEEVAYDVYSVEVKNKVWGLGRIGNLGSTITLKEFAESVKKILNAPVVKLVGNPERMITKVAICGGAGMSLLREASRKGADCMVSADLKYHDAQLCDELGIGYIDAGHFHTEAVILPVIKKWLTEKYQNANIMGKIVVSEKMYLNKTNNPLISIV